MTYTISVIDHVDTDKLVEGLRKAYETHDRPAGWFTVQKVGGQSLITFERDAGDDAGVLEQYGEPLNSATAVRQLYREISASLGGLDTKYMDGAAAYNIVKALASQITPENCGVAGLDPAPMSYGVRTSVELRGEVGNRVYVAVMPGTEIQLVRADSVADAEGYLDGPCVTIHFIGTLGGAGR